MRVLIRAFTVFLAIIFVFGLSGSIKAAGAEGTATLTVHLGTADSFAILAGTEVTNVPSSTITGNVGLSPAAGSNYAGLTQAEVTGTIYSVNAAGPAGYVTDPALLTTAKNDLTAAFIDASSRTSVATEVPTELGGTTKTAGVYDSANTRFGITAGAGPLVLDGQGDVASVFIFEMNFDGTGLTVGPGSTVSLINGASACNVFWRVNTATINTTATFKGNILALNSITVANGASIEGRLLARNGNVTLIEDTITVPSCAAVYAANDAAVAAAAAAAAGTSSSTTSTDSSTTSTDSTELPDTGAKTNANGILWIMIIPSGILIVSALYMVSRRKKLA